MGCSKSKEAGRRDFDDDLDTSLHSGERKEN